MNNSTIDELQKKAATTAFQLVWDAIKEFSKSVAIQEAVQRGMTVYAERFLERHGRVKVLSMSEPIPLREIYVAARIVSPDFLNNFSTIDNLQETFLRQGRRSLFSVQHIENKRPGLDVANERQFLNVLGAPGAGKSTFLRRLGLEALLPRNTIKHAVSTALGLKAGLPDKDASQYTHDCLPVLIELRRFRTEEINLSHLIQNELTICGLPESKPLTEVLLKKGRFLILLDGLDEVPGQALDKAIEHIRDFVDRYRKNRFVTSCRTAFYRNYFHHFTDVVLADFDDEQISSFVQNWFRSTEDQQQTTANDFIQILENASNASAKELASTPLLLTFLCLTYDGHQRLPPNRSELYRQSMDILLEKWAASKRVHNEPIYRELHAGLEIQMLAEIAAHAFNENRYFFTRRELTKGISDFLQSELNAPKHLNSDQVLDAVEIQQGLIVQRAQEAWSFSHLTLQEYLTAVWYEGNQQIDTLVRERLFDKRWREVFILVSGIMSKADALLLKMHEVAEASLANAPAAIRLLNWAQEVAVHGGSTQIAAARRVFAIDLMLAIERTIDRTRTLDAEFVLDRALDRARMLDPSLDSTIDGIIDRARAAFRENIVDQCLILIRTINLARIFSGSWVEADQQLKILRAQFANISSSKDGLPKMIEKIKEILAMAMRLPPELSQINGKNRRSLEQYLDTFQLIIDCKNASTRVSRSAWDEFCRRTCRSPEQMSPSGQ